MRAGRNSTVALSILVCGLSVSPVQAGADAPATKQSIAVLAAVAADPVKFKAYCDMMVKKATLGDGGDQKIEADANQIDGYRKILGADFDAAWMTDVPEVDEAFSQLDDKCR